MESGFIDERVLERLEPARLARREDGVRHHALGAGLLVDPLARGNRHLVGQEPVLRNVGGRARDQRDLGVAVEEDLLEVVVPLQVLDGLRLVDQRRVPAGLADRLALAHEGLDARVVAQEMRVHVHDELVFERVGALLRHGGRRGLGPARRRRPRRRCRSWPRRPPPCRPRSGRTARRSRPCFLPSSSPMSSRRASTCFCCLALRRGNVLVAGDDLRRDRRGVRQHLGRHQRVQFVLGQEAHGILQVYWGQTPAPRCSVAGSVRWLIPVRAVSFGPSYGMPRLQLQPGSPPADRVHDRSGLGRSRFIDRLATAYPRGVNTTTSRRRTDSRRSRRRSARGPRSAPFCDVRPL